MPTRDPVTGAQVLAPPGGWTIAGIGGYVKIRTWGTDPGNASSPGSNALRIDVTRWSITSMQVLADITHSGTYGAKARRIVALDWSADIEAVWEFPFTPENRLKFAGGDYTGGHELVLYCGHPLSYPNGAAARYYYAPSGFLEALNVIDSSAGDDVVRCSMTFRGNSRIFLLPDELSACRDYLTKLANYGYTY